MPTDPRYDQWSSNKEARGGKTNRDGIEGKTVTCPCGHEFKVGLTDEREHFVMGSQFPERPSTVGECPILYGWDLAAYFVAGVRQWSWVWLPGEDQPMSRDHFTIDPRKVT